MNTFHETQPDVSINIYKVNIKCKYWGGLGRAQATQCLWPWPGRIRTFNGDSKHYHGDPTWNKNSSLKKKNLDQYIPHEHNCKTSKYNFHKPIQPIVH